MSKTHESNQQTDSKPIQADLVNSNPLGELGGNPSHSRILNLQRTVGNQAVQRIVSEESPGQGVVQRRWNPPFLGDRVRNFADAAESRDQEYDWFHVEARNWSEGGVTFSDSVPPPGSDARGSMQPPAGSTGGTESVPTEE